MKQTNCSHCIHYSEYPALSKITGYKLNKCLHYGTNFKTDCDKYKEVVK